MNRRAQGIERRCCEFSPSPIRSGPELAPSPLGLEVSTALLLFILETQVGQLLLRWGPPPVATPSL